jgi:hypothetical protein
VTLLRKTQFKVLTAYDLEFGVYLRANEVGANEVGANEVGANEVIEIINIHLNDESHLDRISQIKSIEEVLYKSNKVILGGDFNQVYKVSSQLYKIIAKAGLMPTIHEPTYYIEKKMCIDNLMLKGFQLDNRCPIKKNELNCCNRPINKRNKTKKKNGSCVINKYKNQVENQFNAYGSDHLLIIANVI